MTQETIQKVLSEAEQNYVAAFAENETQFDAVHKLMAATLRDERHAFIKSLNGNKEISNEHIGARLRGLFEGVRLVEAAFRDLGTLKKQPLKDKPVHPGR